MNKTIDTQEDTIEGWSWIHHESKWHYFRGTISICRHIALRESTLYSNIDNIRKNSEKTVCPSCLKIKISTEEPTREKVPKKELTFNAFREANLRRCAKWHPKGINSWSTSDWITAVVGEVGELASLVKMQNRERDGLVGNKFSPTKKQIADEIADVVTYLDILAASLDINLGEAASEKFNEISKRNGFTDKIET